MAEKRMNQNKEDYALLKNNFLIRHISGKFVVNSVFSMVFLYVGSLIDTLIVGLFLGESGLSAMSLVSPVYLVYYTVGALIGIGASIVSSRYLGGNNIKDYCKVFTCATWVMAAAVGAMTLLGYLFLDPLSVALSGGTAGEETQLVKQYLLYYLPGGALNLLAYIPMYFLKTDGRPKISTRLFFVSAVVNVVFSWVLMNPKIGNMGIGGASLATTVSLGLSAVLGFWFLLKGPTQLHFVSHAISGPLLRKVAVAGIPNSLSNLLESARILLINMLLLKIGAAWLLPCYTVVRNVSDLLFSIIAGIASALIPVIGLFYGERDYVNERSVVRLSVRVGIWIMVPLVLLVSVLPEPIFRLFGVTDPLLIAQGRWALPLSCVGMVVAYLNSLYIGYLTSINRELLATILVALRLFVLLAVFAVSLAFTVGANGIWLSLSLAEIATYLVFLLIRYGIRRKNPNIDGYFLDTSKEKEEDISFSVKNDVMDIVNASQKVSDYCESVELDMRRSMKAGNAVEEILTVLIKYCLGSEKDNFVDVRVYKMEEEVMLRFRYIGKLFDPVAFLHEHEGDEDMEEELLGITMIEKGARLVSFRQTLGANTLMIIF